MNTITYAITFRLLFLWPSIIVGAIESGISTGPVDNSKAVQLYKLHFDPSILKLQNIQESGKYPKNFFKNRIEFLLSKPLDMLDQLSLKDQEEIFTNIHSYKSIYSNTYGKVFFSIVNILFFIFVYERNRFFHLWIFGKINNQIHNTLFNLVVLHTTTNLVKNQMLEVLMTFYSLENFGTIMEDKFQSRLKEEVNKKKVTLKNETASDTEILKYYNQEYLLEILLHNPQLKTILEQDCNINISSIEDKDNNLKIIDFLYAKWYKIEEFRSSLRIIFFFFPFIAFRAQRYPSFWNIYLNNRIFLIATLSHVLLQAYYGLKMSTITMDLFKVLLQVIIFNTYWFVKYTRYETKLHRFSTFLSNNKCVFDEDIQSMAYIVEDNGEEPEVMNSIVNTGIIKLMTM